MAKSEPIHETQAIRLEAPLGDLAVAKGFATHDQVRECLDFQAALSKQGAHKRLGDLMVERGYLLPHQLEVVVREQQSAPVQRRIKDYELLAKLGEGGMGMVLKARKGAAGPLVALKVLFKRLAADEQYISRFQREAQIGLTLDHPNLVKCLEVGEADGLHFMVLQYVDGEDLGQWLQRRSYFPEAQALAILMAAAKGMDYAHCKGLVHRDVKPANIMLTRDGQVKVMDFGLARKAMEDDHHLTTSGIVMGTPHYISPEQVEGKVELDGRSDMYSLGLTLFHMLAGRPPYIGGNLYEIFNSHVSQRVPDPRIYNRGISPEAAELVRWMCVREREQRMPSMERLIIEVGRTLGFPSAGPPAVSPLSALLEAPVLKQLASTQATYADIREQLRCPRCSARYTGDPMLVSKDQRLRCIECGLVFPCPVQPPPPPPILPEVIQVEAVEEAPQSAPPHGVAGAAFFNASAGVLSHRHSQAEGMAAPLPAPAAPAFNEYPVWAEAPHILELPPRRHPWLKRLFGFTLWLLGAAAILAGAAWVGWKILSGGFDHFFK